MCPGMVFKYKRMENGKQKQFFLYRTINLFLVIYYKTNVVLHEQAKEQGRARHSNIVLSLVENKIHTPQKVKGVPNAHILTVNLTKKVGLKFQQ